MSVCTNIYQQIFCLSMKICSAAKDIGTATELSATLNANMAAFIADPDFANSDSWELAWGPQVWQAPCSTVVDQAVAVCYNSTQNIYVVPIAATNPNSPYDVFFEDLAVPPGYMHPIGGGAGNVSAGNWAALQALLSLEDGATTLGAFLAGKANADATLVFCGHSLGGGLTPLLAYSLYPAGTASGGWKAVHSYPTAGPATADATFAAAFAKAFPVVSGTGYQMWNANQYNARDIVPNAWAPGGTGPNLSDITATPATDPMFVTGVYVDMAAEVVALRKMAQALAGGSDNPYAVANCNPLFTGTRQHSPITDDTALAQEILYQHIQAYIDQFGVGALFPGDSATRNIQPPLLALAVGRTGARARVEELEPA